MNQSNSAAPPRSGPRLLAACAVEELSPHLRRVWLQGEALAGFPASLEGAPVAGSHIKLMLARPGQRAPQLPVLDAAGEVHWPPRDVSPIKRTYTVAAWDPVQGRLAVDFVLHAASGPAADWARNVQAGSLIGVAGPGGPRRFAPQARHWLLLGDASAAPMLSACLQQMQSSPRPGLLLLQSAHANGEDLPPLTLPPGMQLARLGYDCAALIAALQAHCQEWQAEDWRACSITLAGESSQVVAARDWLLAQGAQRAMMYAVPYWKQAHDEEAYHAERHRIMDELGAE
ncbi:siderophore-interacting protein [Massilia sp. W12]|uniref:siderophore-interacting protein n=1 Tax=Massilia sp. W12 TaxID=3126507 RepID=UPI0030CE5A3D